MIVKKKSYLHFMNLLLPFTHKKSKSYCMGATAALFCNLEVFLATISGCQLLLIILLCRLLLLLNLVLQLMAFEASPNGCDFQSHGSSLPQMLEPIVFLR
jgi:hypothetical protein